MNKGKAGHVGALISFLLCTLLAVGVSLWQMSFQENSLLGGLCAWSNGCFAAAVLWGSIGLLLLIARFDGFLALQYMGYTFRTKWSKMRGGDSPHLDSYYEYMQKKRETRGVGRMIKLLLIPAVIYLLAAVVLTVLFEQIR